MDDVRKSYEDLSGLGPILDNGAKNSEDQEQTTNQHSSRTHKQEGRFPSMNVDRNEY
jgi:hypothetical protein